MGKTATRAAREAYNQAIETACADLPTARWASGRAVQPTRRKATIDEHAYARSRDRNVESTPTRRLDVTGQAVGPVRELARVLSTEGLKGREAARTVLVTVPGEVRDFGRLRGRVDLPARGEVTERGTRKVPEERHARSTMDTYGMVCDPVARTAIQARNLAMAASQGTGKAANVEPCHAVTVR